jgi:hypothetical protein
MIEHCFNPTCGRELRYLRQGSVYQVEKGAAESLHSEFFWLCRACAGTFHLTTDGDGSLSLQRRSGGHGETKRGDIRIRRVFGEILNQPDTRRSA